MSKSTRFEQILEMLDNEQYVSARKLSEKLFVSIPTIRRDLSTLEKNGLIIRSRGGAHRISAGHHEIPIDFRSTVKVSEKRLLCKEAAKLIKDNSVIFIDGSSTVSYLINYLNEKKDITVITNGIKNCFLLASKGIKTISLGGEIIESSLVYAGDISLEILKRFNIDIMFFSAYGIDGDFISETNLNEALLKQNAMRRSKKTVFICDGEKIGLTAKYNICEVKEPDIILTNSKESNFYTAKKVITI